MTAAPRIFMKVQGGLGNQMFQYAAALMLRDAWAADTVLDLVSFGNRKSANPRPYRLDAFDICMPTYAPTGMEALLWRWLTSWRRGGRLRDAACRLAGLALVDESWSPPRRPAARRVSVCGYWQDPAYLTGREGRLRKAFTFTRPPAGRNAAALEEIAGRTAVAVHFRRGDYTVGQDRTLPEDFYRRAFEVMASTVRGAAYYLFSDDPQWVASQGYLPHDRVVVDWNSEEHPEEDLRLMAGCRHHIIANSTLSWWGAWLASSPGQVVLAPRQWTTFDAGVGSPMVVAGWTALDAVALGRGR